MYTEKQIAYAESLRERAHKIVADAMEETLAHPAFTESKRATVEANVAKVNGAIDRLNVQQILDHFTICAVHGYFSGQYIRMNKPLKEVISVLKICKVW